MMMMMMSDDALLPPTCIDRCFLRRSATSNLQLP
jgi:hypothetical protein